MIWASDKDRSGITYARTLINEGDTFRYEIPNVNTDLNWMNTDFDDDEWSIGNSGFGYSDGDDNTYIAAGTLAVYLRKSFTIDDVSEINSLVLDVDYDDGFVAYINGQEVARANTPQKSGKKPQPIKVENQTGRNEKVVITDGNETKEVKWKKAKPLLDSGQWQRV